MNAASPSHCLTMKRVGEFKQRAAAAPASPSPSRSPVSPLPHNLVDPRLNIMKHQRASTNVSLSKLIFPAEKSPPFPPILQYSISLQFVSVLVVPACGSPKLTYPSSPPFLRPSKAKESKLNHLCRLPENVNSRGLGIKINSYACYLRIPTRPPTTAQQTPIDADCSCPPPHIIDRRPPFPTAIHLVVHVLGKNPHHFFCDTYGFAST